MNMNRRDEFNDIMKRLTDFYQKNERLLVYHLYDIGYTMEKVAGILDVSKQSISVQYPKEEYERQRQEERDRKEPIV